MNRRTLEDISRSIYQLDLARFDTQHYLTPVFLCYLQSCIIWNPLCEAPCLYMSYRGMQGTSPSMAGLVVGWFPNGIFGFCGRQAFQPVLILSDCAVCESPK
jgi:hypothetical protein